MNVSVDQIKKLREQTGAGIADCREALAETSSDMEAAQDILKKRGLDKASAKSGREVTCGVVETYSHVGRVGVVVEVLCETDFVAKTPDFKFLAHEIALQISAMNPENLTELLSQEYIRDTSVSVEDLVKSVVAKLGENIQIGKFTRIELGK